MDTFDDTIYAKDTAQGASYRWFQCAPDSTELFNTNAFLTATYGFSFGVEITRGECVEQSECIYVQKPEGIAATGMHTPFKIFPNPSRGQIFIDMGKAINVDLKVYAANGQIVFSDKGLSGLHEISLSSGKGVYLVQLMHEQTIYNHGIIIH